MKRGLMITLVVSAVYQSRNPNLSIMRVGFKLSWESLCNYAKYNLPREINFFLIWKQSKSLSFYNAVTMILKLKNQIFFYELKHYGYIYLKKAKDNNVFIHSVCHPTDNISSNMWTVSYKHPVHVCIWYA